MSGPAGAAARLQAAAQARVASLRGSLGRSRSPADAAALGARLDALEAAARGGSAAAYLALCRELRALRLRLHAAEARRYQADRGARAALADIEALLLDLRPALRGPLARLLRELPLDAGAEDRLRAVTALVEARLRTVPHLAAARPRWKR